MESVFLSNLNFKQKSIVANLTCLAPYMLALLTAFPIDTRGQQEKPSMEHVCFSEDFFEKHR